VFEVKFASSANPLCEQLHIFLDGVTLLLLLFLYFTGAEVSMDEISLFEMCIICCHRRRSLHFFRSELVIE
jgi:hypothetical protein